MSIDKIILVTQYHISDEKRKPDIDMCLIKNIENIFIDEVHLLLEKSYNLDFILDKYKHKLKQVIIRKRLSYEDAFRYYNQNLANKICVLTNPDVYLDSSIELLRHVNFNLDVILALNHYETNTKLLNGMTYNDCEEFNLDYIKPYHPSIWNQSAWVWCRDKMLVPNSAIELGSECCDNRIANVLKSNGFNIINPSHLICVNHIDTINTKTNEYGITNCDNRKRIKSNKGVLFLENLIDIPDKYTKTVNNQTLGLVQSTSLEKIISEITLNESQILSSSSLNDKFLPKFSKFDKPGEWIPGNNDKNPYLQFNFENLYEIAALDIKGKTTSKDDLLVAHITKFKISYVDINDMHVWIHDNTIYNAIHGSNISRIYFKKPIICNKIRVYPLEFQNLSSLKVKLYKIDYPICDVFDYCSNHVELNKYYNNEINYFNYNEIQKINIYTGLMAPSKFEYKKNILGENILDGICLYIYVMNRTENIKSNIQTWLNQTVDQVIIIDWSSNEDFYDFINGLGDERVLYVREPNEASFYRTSAQNLAGDLCRYNKKCKLDSDITLSEKFFENHPLTEGMFYVGEWLCGRNENEKHTHGNTYLWLKDYHRINGYNEYVKSYGWDDSDFTVRLMLCGLKKVLFNLNMFYHVPHDDKSRMSNLNTKKPPLALGLTNRLCCQGMKLWSRQNQKNRYLFKSTHANYLLAERIKEDINIFDKQIYEKSYRDALKGVFSWLRDWHDDRHTKEHNSPNPDYEFIESYLFTKLHS
jgi:hypothetical protein